MHYHKIISTLTMKIINDIIGVSLCSCLVSSLARPEVHKPVAMDDDNKSELQNRFSVGNDHGKCTANFETIVELKHPTLLYYRFR